MQTADHEVLTAAADWLDAGQRVYLATVARTWGSSPRPPGAMMAVRAEDARFVGSVSGGCIEDDLSARLAAQGDSQVLPGIESYGVSAEHTHRFGLPCGGRLDLVVEQLSNAQPLRIILHAMQERRLLQRSLCLRTGEVSLHTSERDAQFHFDGENLVKLFGPSWRLLLIGAGQLSRFVAQMGQALDYEVVVCDPREDYARSWSVSNAPVDLRSPDDAVRALASDTRTAVLALTHEPKLDDLALMEALQLPAFYVGALGSRNNNAKRRQRLASLDLSAAAIARLHGPIGLPIGSRTPAEIAVAILAELTAVRNGIALHARDAAIPEIEKCPASSVFC